MIDKDGPMLNDDAMSGQGARAKLSVIISVYNSESTLRKLVDEVVATLSPRLGGLEIILVNDGSTDGSHWRPARPPNATRERSSTYGWPGISANITP